MNKQFLVLALIAALGFSGTANATWAGAYYGLGSQNSQSGNTSVAPTWISDNTGQPVTTGIQTIGTVTVSASSAPGVLKASVWSASNVDSVAFTGVSDYAYSHAIAAFNDRITINSPNPALIGQTVTINSSLLLSGNMLSIYNIIGNNYPPHTNINARVSMTVTGTGVSLVGSPTATEYHGYNGNNLWNISKPAPSVIPVSFTAQLGSLTNIQYGLYLDGYSWASFEFRECGGSYGPCGAHASSELTADYASGLLWGGIRSVTDANGSPIVGFTVSSDSGFNYAQAVPEPGSWAMLLVAVGQLGWMARRKGRA